MGVRGCLQYRRLTPSVRIQLQDAIPAAVRALAELAYQCAQGLTDPRLGQSTPLGAASKVQFLGQYQENPERVLTVLADIGLVTAPPSPQHVVRLAC
jgi:hypothetical protein